MSKEYVEPIVADNSGNVYISIKTANEYMDKYMKTLLEVKKYAETEKEDLISGGEVCEDILEIVDKALGDDK